MHTKSTNSKSSCILHMKIRNILKYTCAIYVQTTICCQSAYSNANVYLTSIFKHIRIISYLPKPFPSCQFNPLIYSHLRYTKDKGRGKYAFNSSLPSLLSIILRIIPPNNTLLQNFPVSPSISQLSNPAHRDLRLPSADSDEQK